MAHIIKQINIELTAKLAISALLTSVIVVTGAKAIDTGIEAEDNVHLEHKLWLDENTSNDHNDDMTQEEYEDSQRAKEIADANASLAKIKAYADGDSK
ncbi:hypothetical protein [Psychrobacter sp. PAMC 21119]|uniref:hypothetical protein n=1 Tax=Psychrobacter sp. PAMC 21119 TaxID=1112209 RepID=UPI000288B2E8|nr:hypothetical protein [Psychrobacter sp. PAMC 21119]